MCGRMSLFKPARDIEGRFGVKPGSEYHPRYNIVPQDDLDVITDFDAEEMDRFNWGLQPRWRDEPLKDPPINARAETVAEKPFFRDAFAKRRCLVPADGFFEWQGSRGSKRPYRIERPDDGLFAFAGLWETWSDNGEDLRTVAILTTEPNGVVEPIHDRMPVILEPDEEETWLESDDADVLQSLLDPYPDDLTDAYEISTAVNNPANDSPEIMEPLGHGQSGLGEFD